MDTAVMTSYLILILAPIFTYFGVSEVLGNAIAGAIAGLIMLYIAIKNEQNPSDVLSGTDTNDEELDEC